MDLVLRIALFAGLVFHKVLWELLKRKDRSSRLGHEVSASPEKQCVKFGKGMLLVFLLCQTLFWEILPISDQPMFLQVTGTGVYVLGLTVAVLGRIQLGSNWIDLEDYRVLPRQSLVTRGVYRYVRHPIYTGDVLLLLGLELALNSWLVLGVPVLIVVVVRQASAEEKLLSKSFPEYGVYRSRTKRFIPFIA